MIIQAQFGNATGALDPEGFFCSPSYGELDTALIARYGKMAMYGNSGTRLVFETTDNRRGLIIVSKQADPIRKTLAKFSKKLRSYIYKLSFGQYVVIWTDLKPEEV